MLVSLRIWTPDGDVLKTDIEDQEDLVRELRSTGQKYCCRARDLDYQVGDGIRVVGDPNSQNREISIDGVPSTDDSSV